MANEDDSDTYSMPLDAVSSRVRVERGRGRPRSVARRPAFKQSERQRWLRQQLDAHVEADSVVRASRDASGGELIQDLSVELAREAAALLWERQRHAPGTREAERTSSRRVKALVDLARLQLVRAHLAGDDVDLRSPGVQRVVALFVERVGAVVADVLPAGVAEKVMVEWRAAVQETFVNRDCD